MIIEYITKEGGEFKKAAIKMSEKKFLSYLNDPHNWTSRKDMPTGIKLPNGKKAHSIKIGCKIWDGNFRMYRGHFVVIMKILGDKEADVFNYLLFHQREVPINELINKLWYKGNCTIANVNGIVSRINNKFPKRVILNNHDGCYRLHPELIGQL